MDIYLLWGEDPYIDLDGSPSPDTLLGLFDSLESMNRKLEEQWFELPFDTRGLSFSKDARKRVEQRKACKGHVSGKSLHYEIKQLNEL